MPSSISADRYIQGLISSAVDGELTSAEKSELEALRQERPEIVDEIQEMRSVADRVTAIGLQDPAPDLYQRIVARLPDSRTRVPTGQATTGILARLRDALGSAASHRPALAMAYAFALGLVVAVPAAVILQQAAPGNDHLATGAIGAAGVIESSRSPVLLGEENVTVALTRFPSAATVHIPAFGRGTASIQISYTAAALTMRSMEFDDKDGAFDISSSPGAVRIVAPSPAGVTLTFEPITEHTQQSIAIRLESQGATASTEFDLDW